MPMSARKPYSIVIMQFWQLVCASLLILSMASCKKELTVTPPTASTSPSQTEVPSPTASTAPVSTGTDSTSAVEIEVPAPKHGTTNTSEKSASLNELQIKIGSTSKAIAAGKLAEAKTESIALETAWKSMENGVLSKSVDRYKVIIASEIKSVVSGIDSKKDKDALLASLDKINQNIDILRK
jgi:hypothetical protein